MGKPSAKLSSVRLVESLLEEAVRLHAIPQWPYEASYDRVIVFSVPEDKASRETFSATSTLYRPDTHISREGQETPRGILVSAGLGARDVLRSHAMGLGHMVWVARLSPWRHEVDRDVNGKVISFLFLRVGDIVGSEHVLQWTREGKVSVEVDGTGQHRYRHKDGATVPRFDPPSYVG